MDNNVSGNEHRTDDEPRTPAWFTALGIALFVAAGIVYLVSRPAAPTLEQLQQPGEATAQPPSSAPTAEPAPAAPDTAP